MTQAIHIPPAPAIIPAATYLRPEVLATYETIDDVPYKLQAMETVMIYIDRQGNVTHLNGPKAGDEGVRFHENLQGEQHLPFEQVVTEGAYQFGATIERVNYLARKINLRVYIGRPGMNNFTYRACEDRWWRGQDEGQGGYFGVFTRFSGWRFIEVWPEKTIDTTQKRDPVAYDNNQAIWDVNWLAPRPYYTTPAFMSQPWKAKDAGKPDFWGFYHGTIAVPNMGDIATYVEYLITDGAGICIVQDNSSERSVELPMIFPTDGQVHVDTDPTQKTLVTENDPFDDELYKVLRAAGLLNFFLIGSPLQAAEAMWLRGYVRFMYTIPPKSVAHLHVKHNNPNAQIVAKVTQRYKRSR